MSTRANIIIKKRINDTTSYTQIYHHFDGYPSGVGKELCKMLMKFIEADNKNDIFETTDSLAKEINNINSEYEIEFTTTNIDEINLHPDIEYLYVVDMNIDTLYMKEFISKSLHEYSVQHKYELNSSFYDELNKWQHKPYKDIYEEARSLGEITYGFPLRDLDKYIKDFLDK